MAKEILNKENKMNLTIGHDREGHQFFATIDGQKAWLNYTVLPEGTTLDYKSTFTPPELRGQGIAGKIVEFALEHAKANHYKVIPSCPYVRAYIERHPQFRTLVSE